MAVLGYVYTLGKQTSRSLECCTSRNATSAEFLEVQIPPRALVYDCVTSIAYFAWMSYLLVLICCRHGNCNCNYICVPVFGVFLVAVLRDTWLVELLIELSIELSIESFAHVCVLATLVFEVG